MRENKNSFKVRMVTESAIMLALATVLSLISIFPMPLGGKITPLSMLPVVLISIKYGIGTGVPVAALYSVIQLMLGLPEALGWGITPTAFTGMVFLDYIIPFTALGFAGFLRKFNTRGYIAGISAVMAARFLSHFFSGTLIFWEWAEKWELNLAGDPTLHSILYNGFYMLPELVFTAAGALVLLKTPYTKKLFQL